MRQDVCDYGAAGRVAGRNMAEACVSGIGDLAQALRMFPAFKLQVPENALLLTFELFVFPVCLSEAEYQL